MTSASEPFVPACDIKRFSGSFAFTCKPEHLPGLSLPSSSPILGSRQTCHFDLDPLQSCVQIQCVSQLPGTPPRIGRDVSIPDKSPCSLTVGTHRAEFLKMKLDNYYLTITLFITIAYQLFFFLIAFALKFDKLTDFAGGTNFLVIAIITLSFSGVHYTRVYTTPLVRWREKITHP